MGGGVCAVVAVLLFAAFPANVTAYHAFDPPPDDPPKFVRLEWSFGQKDFDPKVAVADHGGQRYVYVAWWHHITGWWELWFRRLVSSGQEGEGPWSETARLVAFGDIVGGGGSAAYRDLALAAHGQDVYLAWTQYDDPRSLVWVARSSDNGASFPSVSTPIDEGAPFSYVEPDLAVTDEYAYLVRTRFSPTEPMRVQVLRLCPLPELKADVTADTHPAGAEWPAVAAHGTTVAVAFQRCTDCADPATLHVHAVQCVADLAVCIASPTPVSEGATTPSGAPVLANFGRHVHIAWQAGAEVVYQRLERGPFLSWDPATRAVVAPASGIPDGQTKYAVAAYGHGVAVAYRNPSWGPLQLRRNVYNGQPGSWQAPEDADCGWCEAGEVHVAVDARHEIAGEKGNIVQLVWARKENGAWSGVAHRRVPTEERERQAAVFLDLAVAQGQAAVTLGEFAYVFGGDVPDPTDRIWRYSPDQEFLPPEDTGHRLWPPLAYASAVRVGGAAYIFYGRTSPPAPTCVQKYDGTGDAGCVVFSETADRHGTSAVYDGARYAYVFGGKTSTGDYLDLITRWDAQTDQVAGWGVCPTPTLPYGLAFGSAAWHPGEGVAYLFGGERAGVPPAYSPRNSYNVYKFDPADPDCPTVQPVSLLPCPPWDACGIGDDDPASVRPGPGTVAVYAGGDAILVAGGRHLYPDGTFADSRYIWAFGTMAHTWGLKFVDLPACKSHGSGVWFGGRLYYFAGYEDADATQCAAGGNQVVRYDVDTH